MLETSTKNLTDIFEGVLYPTPIIVPDKSSKSLNPKGFVVFDYRHFEGITDYVEMDGSLNLNTFSGITEDNLYHCARKYLESRYGSKDIIFGKPTFSSKSYHHRVLIRYKVNL